MKKMSRTLASIYRVTFLCVWNIKLSGLMSNMSTFTLDYKTDDNFNDDFFWEER